ncbi:DUF3378 domain-containing protein [Ureaplasma canigenitalium]|uniref:DUF3378 domain-containing protein n=1 Tax=Ureaplasma canigenitalium TaxID=42092 RepID=UPI0004E15EDB|nr:DUF3378 domain-containing protein [Ureaplasma canigenitalium]
MQPVTLTLEQDQINTLMRILSSYKAPNNNIYLLYFFKIKDIGSISVYQSRKVVFSLKDASSFLFIIKKANQDLYLYLKQHIIAKKETTINKKINEEMLFDQYDFVIGNDETGVGDVFLGIVVCSVMVDYQKYQLIKDDPLIRDSKTLTDDEINKTFLKYQNTIPYNIGVSDAPSYNAFIKKIPNSHILKTKMHYLAFKTNINKINGNKNYCLILDRYVSDKKMSEYFDVLGYQPIKININVPGAESQYKVVALASIFARAMQNQIRSKLAKEIGFFLPYGANNQVIYPAVDQLYHKYGNFETIDSLVKQHFKNYQTIKEEYLAMMKKNK